jgi:hypothetical protein
MPLPGLNPIEAAPPADSTQRVATANQTARLHQRVQDLNRQVDQLSKQVGSGQWASLSPTYFSGWSAHPAAAHVPRYYKQGHMVMLAGLVYTASGANTTTGMCTFPEELRPAPNGGGELYFALALWSGTGYSSYNFYLYPGDAAGGVAGQLRSGYGAPGGGFWVSLAGMCYPVL